MSYIYSVHQKRTDTSSWVKVGENLSMSDALTLFGSMRDSGKYYAVLVRNDDSGEDKWKWTAETGREDDPVIDVPDPEPEPEPEHSYRVDRFISSWVQVQGGYTRDAAIKVAQGMLAAGPSITTTRVVDEVTGVTEFTFGQSPYATTDEDIKKLQDEAAARAKAEAEAAAAAAGQSADTTADDTADDVVTAPMDWGRVLLIAIGLGIGGLMLWYLWVHRHQLVAAVKAPVAAPAPAAPAPSE